MPHWARTLMGALIAWTMVSLPAIAQVGQVLREEPGADIAATATAVRLPHLRAAPPEAFRGGLVAPTVARMPKGRTGDPGPRGLGDAAPPPEPEAMGGIGPRNHGFGKRNSIYHYSDRLVDTELVNDAVYRSVGRFAFVYPGGFPSYCTASLIARSILLAAGHCVHEGGSRERGWIKSGRFYPAYIKGSAPYGTATAAAVYTTSGWFNEGELDKGYDVSLIVLNKQEPRGIEIGTSTGYLPFCHADCLQPFNFLNQLGYPINYYDGRHLTQSDHLAKSDSRDYVFGTGMEGGSSGGPLIANLGQLRDESFDPGQFTPRNWVFAVMSWGFSDTTAKLAGASSLSGPNNANNFKALFNKACQKSRELHGRESCTPL